MRGSRFIGGIGNRFEGAIHHDASAFIDVTSITSIGIGHRNVIIDGFTSYERLHNFGYLDELGGGVSYPCVYPIVGPDQDKSAQGTRHSVL
jgi:hypothetical protein